MKIDCAKKIVICLVVSYFLGCFFKTSSNIIMPMYQEIFGLSSSWAGVISGLFFLPYAVMQVMCGSLCNRYGEARIVGIGLFLTAIGSLCFALGTDPAPILVGRFVTGIGVGPMYVAVASFVARNYASEKYGFWLGMAFAFGAIGTILASSPLQVMLDLFGTKSVFSVTSAVLILLAAILLALSLRNKNTAEHQPLDFRSLFISPFLKLRKRNNLIFFFAWAVFTSFLTGIQGLWGTKWTSVAFPDMPGRSGIPVMFIGIGSIVASYAAPVIFRVPERRKHYVDSWSFAYFLSYALLVLSLYFAASFSLVVVIACLLGFAEMSAGLQLSTFMRETSDPSELGIVVGISNFSAGIANLAVQAGSGALIDVLCIRYPMSVSFALVFAGFSIVLLLMILFVFRLEPSAK